MNKRLYDSLKQLSLTKEQKTEIVNAIEESIGSTNSIDIITLNMNNQPIAIEIPIINFIGDEYKEPIGCIEIPKEYFDLLFKDFGNDLKKLINIPSEDLSLAILNECSDKEKNKVNIKNINFYLAGNFFYCPLSAIVFTHYSDDDYISIFYNSANRVEIEFAKAIRFDYAFIRITATI